MATKFTSYKDERLQEIKQRIARALEICGGTGERYAKENLTRNRSVITGNLRNSITHQQINENTEAVGTNVEYAPYVELGTRHSRAKPYLAPAIQNHTDEYLNIIKSELEG